MGLDDVNGAASDRIHETAIDIELILHNIFLAPRQWRSV
jgi:hypothetical protein